MKLKPCVPAISFFCILLSIDSNAQSYVALSSGISKDINNTNKSFYHIPVTLQWEPFPDKSAAMFFRFDYDIPFPGKNSGESFTLNAALPQKVTLEENIRPVIFTTSLGFSMHFYTNKKNNSFYLNLLTGYCHQNIKVNYKNYDKKNYEVLNPDVNLNKGALVLSMAGVYYFHKSKQNMFLMLYVQSPLLIDIGRYPLSYKSIAPLQLTYGYKLFYNRRK